MEQNMFKDVQQKLDKMDPIAFIQEQAASDMTVFALRSVIIIWCLFIVFVALFTKNKWILAGILAYEILP